MSEEVKKAKAPATKAAEKKPVAKAAAKPVAEKKPAAAKTTPAPKVVAEKKPATAKPAPVNVAAPKVSKPNARADNAGTKIKQIGTRATGRRKKSIARVRLVSGSGKVTINGRSLVEYFANGFLQTIVNQPMALTEIKDYDVIVNVQGGGLTGQAGAIRHGIARALCEASPTTRAELKKAGFLTRDPRMKERKKYGLKKARRAPQFSKR